MMKQSAYSRAVPTFRIVAALAVVLAVAGAAAAQDCPPGTESTPIYNMDGSLYGYGCKTPGGQISYGSGQVVTGTTDYSSYPTTVYDGTTVYDAGTTYYDPSVYSSGIVVESAPTVIYDTGSIYYDSTPDYYYDYDYWPSSSWNSWGWGGSGWRHPRPPSRPPHFGGGRPRPPHISGGGHRPRPPHFGPPGNGGRPRPPHIGGPGGRPRPPFIKSGGGGGGGRGPGGPGGRSGRSGGGPKRIPRSK